MEREAEPCRQIDGVSRAYLSLRLLRSHGAVGKAEAIAAARDFGADADRLVKDAELPSAAVDRSMDLAKNLAISGTPSYVVGDEVVVGAVGSADLEAKILNIRKCGKAICS